MGGGRYGMWLSRIIIAVDSCMTHLFSRPHVLIPFSQRVKSPYVRILIRYRLLLTTAFELKRTVPENIKV